MRRRSQPAILLLLRRAHSALSVRRMAALWLILLLGLLGGCAPSPLYPITLIPAECPLPVPEELEEGHTITCGYLQLPQNRAAPLGRQVKLPYAHIRAESAHPHPDPLVYVVGGPGGSALAEFTEVYGWFRTLRRDRDLILYDQRGTLLAEPVLECALDGPAPTTGSENAGTAAIEIEIKAAAARVPAHLHPLDANDLMIARCAEQLQAAGIDLAHYDTPTHARDLLDLVAALGYRTYNLYGTSYGTRIALEVMRLAPHGLRAVVLDSVYPPTANAYETPRSVKSMEVLARAFALCAADAMCNAAYPDLPARFEQAVNALATAPLVLPADGQHAPDSVFEGSDLLQLLLTRLDGALLPYLPRLVDEVARGESATLKAILRGDVPPPSPPRAGPLSAADEARVTEFVLALNGALLTHQPQFNDEATREWQQLMARNADRERLGRFIKSYLPATVARTLLAQLAHLTTADLELVFAELHSIPFYPLTRGAYLAVECRDELPFNNYATAISAHQRFTIPEEIIAGEASKMRHDWAQCALFPTGVAAATQTQAVTSALPVLILQGGLDTITPPSWAAEAQRTLANAIYIEFPTQGHIVIQQPLSLTSGCPASIVRAFLDNPTHPPARTCIVENYAIRWALRE